MTVQELADQIDRLIEHARASGLSYETIIVELEAAVEVLDERLS